MCRKALEECVKGDRGRGGGGTERKFAKLVDTHCEAIRIERRNRGGKLTCCNIADLSSG
jgi:hypothetical protein